MSQRHGVRWAKRDDIGVGGVEVVEKTGLPASLTLHLLLWENKVGALNRAFVPLARAASIEPPVHQAKAHDIDDQDGEAG